jgi:hypothetical protein
MREVAQLKTTNLVIYLLSLLGSVIFIFLGIRGECIEDCEYSTLAVYVTSPTMISTGFAALLISSLLYQVVNLFAVHVEKSHSAS